MFSKKWLNGVVVKDEIFRENIKVQSETLNWCPTPINGDKLLQDCFP